VENLAATLGLAVQPAEVGFAGSSLKCPAKLANPAFAAICTSYGQGGSRVTNPAGIGNATGALTVPMSTQIANHLARFGSFKATDLVLVLGRQQAPLGAQGMAVAQGVPESVASTSNAPVASAPLKGATTTAYCAPASLQNVKRLVVPVPESSSPPMQVAAAQPLEMQYTPMIESKLVFKLSVPTVIVLPVPVKVYHAVLRAAVMGPHVPGFTAVLRLVK
jgi:hypothetical protein